MSTESQVARTTIVPALPDFMAAHLGLELEVSSTDRQVDLDQEAKYGAKYGDSGNVPHDA